MSISVQQEPYWPTPAFWSLVDGFQSTALASPLMNLRSRGHCASQYPVPYLAPALLDEYLDAPPSSSMATKYRAPFRPQLV
jgi:hypothetical protein